MKEQGQFLQSDYFDNTGGINTADSPFKVLPTQATDGTNFTYTQTGAITKRRGHPKINSAADTQLKSLGLGLRNTSTGVKSVIRAAGTKLQLFDPDAPSFTNLTEDTTAAGSDFLTSGSTVPVTFNEFNTATNNVLWAAGGGMSTIYGIYSTSKVTANGTPVPTGTISTSVGGTGGVFSTTGTYYYAVAFRKTGTQALSNAVLDISAVVSATTQKVTITLSTISNIDTTKYDKIYIYRSAVSGVSAFTTGDLVGQANISSTTFVDDGSAITSSTNIPRAASTILDNSVLPTGTYKAMCVFKRRLVTANESTLYFSDVNKPESWPSANTITIPSGGPITALAIISFSTDFSNDEYLAVFKERELWIITGTTTSDWSLKFIDAVGSANQTLVVQGNGFLTWIDYRGIFIWDGSNKPIYASRPIETLFAIDGEIDKSKLNLGWGEFFQKDNIILWWLSHKQYGEQKFCVKLDLKLSLPSVENSLVSRIMDAVFNFESRTGNGLYSGVAFLPSTAPDEVIYLGDDSGFVYSGYQTFSDAGSAISMQYYTPFLAMTDPNVSKRFQKVIVWVEEAGDYNLTLDYWSGYRTSLSDKSTLALPISTANQDTTALWDVASWDLAYWDDYSHKLKAIVFNLNSQQLNNNEGDCIRLRLRQEGVDETVVVVGFSVIYTEQGMKK